MSNYNTMLVANYESDVGYAWWLMENYWCQLSEIVNGMGGNTWLIYPKIGSIPDVIKRSEINVVEQRYDKNNMKSIFRVIKLLRKNKITIVYFTDKSTIGFDYILLRMAGVRKIIMHDHMGAPRKRPRWIKFQIKKLLHGLRMPSCDLCIAVSDYIMDRLIRVNGISRNKCVRVYNGVKIPERNKEIKAKTRGQLGVEDNSVVVVGTGRAAYYKRVDFFIECAQYLVNKRNIPNLYFIFVGDGPDMNDFKEMVRNRGLEKKFFLPGHMDDVAPILISSDIGFQASQGEAFSLSLLEYMSAGLATVASKVGGNMEAIEDGVVGCLFDYNDKRQACRIVEKLVEDEKLRITIGENARNAVVDRYTIEKMNQEFLRCLKNNIYK